MNDDYQRIERVIRHLERGYRAQPKLPELARVAGLSEFHFHRLFSRWAGTTPKAFVQYLTARHARELLLESRSVLDASLESGLSGPGRLHDPLVTVEGASPGELKARGAGLTISAGFHESPFGDCLIGLTKRGICHLSFVDGVDGKDAFYEELRERWPAAEIRENETRAIAAAAARIFSPRRRSPLSIVVSGTPFQLKVWEALLRIPPGRALSYGDLATAVGQPRAARAVGSAVAANTVACLIPCHRVIRETGIIGDYRWGIARKKAILAREGLLDRQASPRGALGISKQAVSGR